MVNGLVPSNHPLLPLVVGSIQFRKNDRMGAGVRFPGTTKIQHAPDLEQAPSKASGSSQNPLHEG
jgi:hypothetical protein